MNTLMGPDLAGLHLAGLDLAGLDLAGLGFGFMLVLARLSGLMLLVPGLGEVLVPVPIRAAIAVGLTLLLLPLLAPALPARPDAPAALLGMLAAELLVGGAIGLLTRLVTAGLEMAAQTISFMTGLSNVVAASDGVGPETSVLARLFGLAAPLLLLRSGLYLLPVRAVVASYRLVPAGRLPGAGALCRLLLRQGDAAFGLGLRLAAPFIALQLGWFVVLGLAERLAPTLHVQALAMPAQIMLGLLLLSVLAPALLHVWLDAIAPGLAHPDLILPG